MANEDEALKRRYREFLDLMPLTLSLAGLSTSEGQRYFTTDQLDHRGEIILNAYKLARRLAREAIRD